MKTLKQTISKYWWYSFLTDVVFFGLFVLFLFVIGQLGRLHPLMKFITSTTKEAVLANPDLLPAKSVLVSGIIFYIALAIALLVGIYLIFILTRQAWYSYRIHGRVQLQVWRTIKRTLAGLILVAIPAAIGAFIIIVVAMLVFAFIAIVFNSKTVYDLRIIFNLLAFVLFSSVCTFYFAAVQKEKIMVATVVAYKNFSKHIKRIFLASVIVVIVSYLFQAFGKFVLGNLVLPEQLAAFWYIGVSVLLLSWMRTYFLELYLSKS